MCSIATHSKIKVILLVLDLAKQQASSLSTFGSSAAEVHMAILVPAETDWESPGVRTREKAASRAGHPAQAASRLWQHFPVNTQRLLYVKAVAAVFDAEPFLRLGEELTGPFKRQVFDGLVPVQPCESCGEELYDRDPCGRDPPAAYRCEGCGRLSCRLCQSERGYWCGPLGAPPGGAGRSCERLMCGRCCEVRKCRCGIARMCAGTCTVVCILGCEAEPAEDASSSHSPTDLSRTEDEE